MPQHYKRKTKNFFIKKNFQGRMILSVFLAVIISCVAFIVIFGLFSADSMTISYKNNDLQMGQTPLVLLKNAIAAHWIFLITCGMLIVIAAIIGTHRIAGPLYRFEKTLDSMNRKNLGDTIHLRGKDEGKELATKINSFNTALSADLHVARRHTRAINDLLNRYDALDRSKLSQDDIESIYQAIASNNRKLKTILESYQLADE